MNLDQARQRLCTRLTGDDAAALDLILTRLDQHQQRRTLGGPPPAPDDTWANRRLPGGPDPEYRRI